MNILIYAFHEQVPKGKVFIMPASALAPEYMVFHSEMEARVVASVTGSTLKHVRDLLPKAEDE